MSTWKGLNVVLAIVLAALLALMTNCGDDGETALPTQPTDTVQPTITVQSIESTTPTEPLEDLTITIGSITDKTAMASSALSIVDMALTDVVEYFNDNSLIPGVELDVIFYDGQYDPAHDIPGYEWLKERGADLMISPVPSVPLSVMRFLQEDEMVLFSPSATSEALDPPGWVFLMGSRPEVFVYTLLDWVAQNDWDYEQKGPAKVGAVGGMDAYALALQDGLEAYCKAHPDQFEWVDGFMVEWTVMTFAPEINALLDCDYVVAPSTGVQTFAFMKEFRESGGTAKYLGTAAQAAFLGLIYSAVSWDDLDGMLFALQDRWWNEQGYQLVDLTWDFLYQKHPDNVDVAVFGGVSYLGTVQTSYTILTLIERTIEEVGAQNFSGQALYETAQSFSITYDSGAEWSFTPTKRAAGDKVGIYRLSAVDEDLVRVDVDWYPIRLDP
ncbi:ABC transporter substrate-binding protein [Chloroflexota bacterium]